MQTLPSPQNIEPSRDRSYNLDDWRSGYRSQSQEFAYWIEDIDGEIPTELRDAVSQWARTARYQRASGETPL